MSATASLSYLVDSNTGPAACHGARGRIGDSGVRREQTSGLARAERRQSGRAARRQQVRGSSRSRSVTARATPSTSRSPSPPASSGTDSNRALLDEHGTGSASSDARRANCCGQRRGQQRGYSGASPSLERGMEQMKCARGTGRAGEELDAKCVREDGLWHSKAERARARGKEGRKVGQPPQPTTLKVNGHGASRRAPAAAPAERGRER